MTKHWKQNQADSSLVFLHETQLQQTGHTAASYEQEHNYSLTLRALHGLTPYKLPCENRYLQDQLSQRGRTTLSAGLSLVGGTMALCQWPRASKGPRAPAANCCKRQNHAPCMTFYEIWSVDFRKIIKIVATGCQILRLKCTKLNFGPHWGDYSTPQAH